jgi:hypothetical protein
MTAVPSITGHIGFLSINTRKPIKAAIEPYWAECRFLWGKINRRYNTDSKKKTNQEHEFYARTPLKMGGLPSKRRYN